MPQRSMKPAWIAGVVLAVVFAGVLAARLLHDDSEGARSARNAFPVPVEVAEVHRGQIVLRRTFSGTLEPLARITVAPKVSGHIRRLHVDVADPVTRGQEVALLEDDEYKQAEAEAEALVAVAEANIAEAQSRLAIAQRELERTKALQERGIASDSALDSAQAQFLTGQASLQVAKAGQKRAQASLAGARIRLGYTRILADWHQGDDDRVVAERFVDEGNTVAANTPLLAVVELDPILAVLQVTEKDYPRLAMGQEAILRTDAYPGQSFTGKVVRIAPVFRSSSRQARVEVRVANPDRRLKPGMFTRATLELDRAEQAVYVPEQALTKRDNRMGVFLVNDAGDAVQWVEVDPGLQDGSNVELRGADLAGRVVTLGQQLIEDGSAVRIAREAEEDRGGSPAP